MNNFSDSLPVTVLYFGYSYSINSANEGELNVRVVDISDTGAKLEVYKRVVLGSDMNNKRGEILIGKEINNLFDILNQYDLKAWVNLPMSNQSVRTSRSLFIASNETVLYDIKPNVKFPETFPPEEDIMYFELYKFFNEIICREEGWESVVSANIEDPRETPSYKKRVVKWFNNEVNLVVGTGVLGNDGVGSEIDYGNKKWWIEEGFVGKWELNKDYPGVSNINVVKEASLTVESDGSAVLVIDGKTYSGKLEETRRYKDSLKMHLKIDDSFRMCTVSCLKEESYNVILVNYVPGAYPNPMYIPIDVILKKI